MSELFFILFLQGIRCLSGDSLDTLDPCPEIPERLGLYFLIYISLGFSILVLLSEELADEIDLDLFSFFTVRYISVLWLDLDLSNDIDSSNDLPFSDLLLMDLFIFLLDACALSVSLTASLFFFNGMSDGFLHHISFCFHVINPFFDHFVCGSYQ